MEMVPPKVAVDLRATVGVRCLGDRRPEVDGYLTG